ncbi:MAG: SipW-dependent-type signal peptide-containing protein [Bacillota bacterium]
MKKTRFIAAVLCVAIVLMGAGYAAWTDQLVINNTVKTGNLDVSFNEEYCYTQVYIGDEDYITATMETSPKVLDVTIDNMYPGTEVCVNSNMSNFGTIPAKFDKATVTIDPESTQALVDAIEIPWLYYYIYDENGDYVDSGSQSFTGVTLTNLESKINTMLAGVQLEPGHNIVLTGEPGDTMNKHFDILLPSTAGDDTESGNVSFSITLDWKQFNQ